jgi:hypothetical protein
MRRTITSVTLASGAAAAASLAIGVASADPDATTITVPDPFGVTFVGDPDITYQTGNATEDIAYGHQTLNFDSANLSPSVEQFFLNNVTVDGHPLNLESNPLIANNLQADVIDKLESNGAAQQQILLPAIPGTNIESGVIGIHSLPGGYAYEYIDLVGPGTTSLNSNGVDHAVGAFLVTPTGTLDVSHWENGGDYGGQAYLESQLLDYDNPVSDPFGVTLEGQPDITYQTVDVFANTAYGSQTADFDSSDLAPFVEDFFTKNVTVDGHPLNLDTNPLIASDLTTHVIDKVQYNGLFDGFSEQQILLPTIAGTNIDHGVIDIENLGNGYSYDYIDLVESGNTNDIGAWLVTPTGAFDVSPFAVLEAQMFDPAAFDPSVYFPLDGLTPPPGFLF